MDNNIDIINFLNVSDSDIYLNSKVLILINTLISSIFFNKII